MLVFDVSSYNTGDLPPCDGIIARVTKKDGKIDSRFAYWYHYANDHKKPFGAYKYTYATSPVIAEIESINVGKYLQGIELPLGFWLDCETRELRYGSDSLLQSVIEEYREAMDLYNIKWGGIYCDFDFYQRHEAVLHNYDIWVARWNYTPGMRKKLNAHIQCLAGWQYTNSYNGQNLDASEWYQSTNTTAEVKYNPDNVRKLQEYLNKHYGYNLNIDGVMGTNTFTAICQSLAK